MTPAPSIVLLRNDLRLHDHAPLKRAIQQDAPILILYIYDPDSPDVPGEASSWWLQHSLTSLTESLERHGHQLTLRKGRRQEELERVIQEAGAEHVFTSSPGVRVPSGCELHRFRRADLFDHKQLLNQSGEPYRVFTPLYKAFLTRCTVPEILNPPDLSRCESVAIDSLQIGDLGLCGDAFWAREFAEHWTPGEPGARQALEHACCSLNDYSNTRDVPARRGTSRLSPHLHFGEISAREVWHQIHGSDLPDSQKNAFTRQLVWREFARYLLTHFPRTTREPMNPRFAKFPWESRPEQFKAWTAGKTGYPIVDAGMRELWKTGWMHNRVRMIVGSFLVKDLRIHWKEGMHWFENTLVDADLPNNVMGWQWIAGCGADAAPYFRVFNPTLQSRKFDPAGDYIRRWVPELSPLDPKYIHEPLTAPADVLANAGITPGLTYPYPIVDHALERQHALDAYAALT